MYLDPATRKPLVAVLEQQLLARHIAPILEKGFDALVTPPAAPCTELIITFDLGISLG